MSHPVPSSTADLPTWLAYIESLHALGSQGIDLNLERCHMVARRMQLQLTCPTIVVAGTNGKGSTCALLEAIYLAAGYRTAVYSSPHLVDFCERLRLSAHPIDAAQLVPHCAAVEAARASLALTYFEFTTLAILSAIQQAQQAGRVDVAILEIGMGGRLDAVNIVDADCAIITNVDLDHMEFLGDTVDQIAREKAGIMRPNRPVIVGDPKAPAVLEQQAEALGAQLWWAGRDFFCSAQAQDWRFDCVAKPMPKPAAQGDDTVLVPAKTLAGLPHPALRGGNQLSNAAGALCAVHVIQAHLPTSAGAIRQGIAQVQLPGRFQVLPGQPVVVLDVAHNPHAARILQLNLDAMGYFARTACVFGAMADKDIVAVLDCLAPVVDTWFFCPLPTARAATAQALLEHWHSRQAALAHTATAQTCTSVADAYASARQQVGSEGRVVVCGSFYTVAAALQTQQSAATPR